MKTVAEGIEYHDQLAQLMELGCDYGQGYLFSKPIPTDQVEILFSEKSGVLI